ncbi:FAD-dependent oxidoreductase [Tenggerimyces flavus]|uniref:FAD-dependent oxidoreductase n=1 Tax=Tenggerimyces flavus TaxID=1708749 RepID=A0ABV7YKB7_9ACTN|nr:FAD-dependent oxidoreductase [Tenggerimyces flavus]MBM7789858.1 glycine/D-amino acid oxidase-like deaminating enzyme [Tenggerimyces flavus]
MDSVVVVGAGIVGASIAYHLAQRGIRVRLVEQHAAPAQGVTGGSFAWVGDTAGGDWPGGADELRLFVHADYERLAVELPDFSLRRSGSLVWTEGSTRPGVTMSVGPGQRLVSAEEIALLEPSLLAVPDFAVFTPGDFAVDPVRLTALLVEGAVSFGAEVSYDFPVTSLDFGASTVVLAAGTGVAGLSPVPVEEAPALLLWASAPEGLVRTIIATPDFEAREVRPGELRLTAPLSVDMERTFATFQASFSGADSARLLGHAVGLRPMPPAGPVIGYVSPSLYVAVLHSALTLGPTVGRLVAEELASGSSPAALARCRYNLGA